MSGGWGDTPGGSELARLIAESFACAEQRDADNEPCSKCGGDRLRTDFTGSGKCHAGGRD